MSAPSRTLSQQYAPDHSGALDVLLNHLHARGLRPSRARDGARVMAYCPLHEADGQRHRPSFTAWRDAAGRIGLKCWAGCSSAALRALLAVPGMSASVVSTRHEAPLLSGQVHNVWGTDAAPLAGAIVPRDPLPSGARWVHHASYRYTDADDRLCGVVDRFHAVQPNGARVAKSFRQRRPAFPRVGWLHGLDGGVLPLYRLSTLLHRPEGLGVVVVEGEKAVHALMGRLPHLAVTTAPGGAAGWRPAHSRQLLSATACGAEVLLWPDADAPGATWLDTLVTALHPHRRMRVVGEALHART